MEFLVLTKTSGFLGPITKLLGPIMEGLFRFTSLFGILSIGLCIILFTLVTELSMFPFMIKQQKSSKLMSVMQPEIQAVQKKYKGKQDQESMMRMNVEAKAIYEKYDTSMTGGCLPTPIQLPIMFTLYRMTYNIPAYISIMCHYFDLTITKLPSGFASTEVSTGPVETHKLASMDYSSMDKVVDLLYKLTDRQWDEMTAAFPDIATVVIQTGKNVIEGVSKMQQFSGINIAYTPLNAILGFLKGGSDITVFAMVTALLIPTLSGLTQRCSTKLMTSAQPQTTEDASGGSMTKTMSITMPLISVVSCFSFPIDVDIYWVASSVFQVVQQVGINAYLNKIDIDDLIKKNVKKAGKKRAKKGPPPTRITQNASATLKSIQAAEEKEEVARTQKVEKSKQIMKDSMEYYNIDTKPGSLTSKAAIVQKYNERHNKQER